MLDCFNEGFSDEDKMAATQVPRVYLNFTKAHLEELPIQTVRDMSPQQVMRKETLQGESCLVIQEASSSERRRRHHSAQQRQVGKLGYDTFAQACNIDPEVYLREAREQERPATQQGFQQFKKTFVNSPKRKDVSPPPQQNHEPFTSADQEEPFNFKNVGNRSSLNRGYTIKGSTGETTSSNVKVVHQKSALDFLEFSPEDASQAQVDTSRPDQTPLRQSLYVMEPIPMNTPAALLRKKSKFDAVVQGITIPLESLTLSCSNQPAQAQQNGSDKKENSVRQSCVVRVGKKAMRKLKESKQNTAKASENLVPASNSLSFVGISKRVRF